MRRVITIGEFDPTARSGVVLDRTTLNGFGLEALTLVNTIKLSDTETAPVSEEILAAQLSHFIAEEPRSDVKTGRLARRANIETVASHFEDQEMGGVEFVVDACVDDGPQRPLLKSSALSLVRMRLLPLATMVIAYQSEAAVLAGVEVTDITQMKAAAEAIHVYGGKAVLVRADGPVDDENVDIFYDDIGHQFLFRGDTGTEGIRVTRDLFAAALLAYLSQGRPPTEAIEQAQKYEARFLTTRREKPA